MSSSRINHFGNSYLECGVDLKIIAEDSESVIIRKKKF